MGRVLIPQRIFALVREGFFFLKIAMDKLEYNFELLKATRERKKIAAYSIAADLCLAERHIRSIEENSLQYFSSQTIKYAALKKYTLALGLNLEDVIHNLNEVDPLPVLLRKK